MKRYKNWGISYGINGMYKIYTPDEMEQPAGFREPEAEFERLDDAKTFIDHY